MSTADAAFPTDSAPPAGGGTLNVRILRSSADGQVAKDDRVAVEAPLEFLLHHPALGLEPMSFGTTMRTPGDDESLAAGLLYGEGIVNQPSDIEAIESSTRRPNVVNVRLRPTVQIVPNTPSRLFSAGSSCGVCGTTGLDAAIARAAATHIPDTGHVALSLLFRLPNRMRSAQSKFGDTGGVHASALFDFAGTLLNIAEDVGRHNAFDKLVGMTLLIGRSAVGEPHRGLERPRQLRAGAKSNPSRRERARRHRCSLQPRGQSRVDLGTDPSGIPA